MNSAVPPAAAAPKRGLAARPWWPWAKRALTLAFFGLIAWLLIRHARAIEWSEVWTSIRNHPRWSLALGAALAFSSHLLYACIDLFGRAHTRHGLPKPMVMLTAFVSYAFNLNMGALVGGIAFRYRLYARMGLDTVTTSQVLAMSMLTNWLGYALLAGMVFLFRPFPVPEDWAIGTVALRVLGAGLICVAVGYVAMCAFSTKRDWSLRGHELRLPSLRFALLQLAMSTLSWALIGGIIYALLQARIDYFSVLGVLLVAAVAGVITHVPAGLGVLEAVFVALLSNQMPAPQLLAGLLVYRGMYYLAPLMIATVLHLVLEARTRDTSDEASGAG